MGQQKFQATYRASGKCSDEFVDKLKADVAKYPSFSEFVNAIYTDFLDSKRDIPPLADVTSQPPSASSTNEESVSSSTIDLISSQLDSMKTEIILAIEKSAQDVEEIQAITVLDDDTEDKIEIHPNDKIIEAINDDRDALAKLFHAQNRDLSSAFKNIKSSITEIKDKLDTQNDSSSISSNLDSFSRDFSAFKQDLLMTLLKRNETEPKQPVIIQAQIPEQDLSRTNEIKDIISQAVELGKEQLDEHSDSIISEIDKTKNEMMEKIAELTQTLKKRKHHHTSLPKKEMRSNLQYRRDDADDEKPARAPIKTSSPEDMNSVDTLDKQRQKEEDDLETNSSQVEDRDIDVSSFVDGLASEFAEEKEENLVESSDTEDAMDSDDTEEEINLDDDQVLGLAALFGEF